MLKAEREHGGALCQHYQPTVTSYMKLSFQYSKMNNLSFVFVSLKMSFETFALLSKNYLSFDTNEHISNNATDSLAELLVPMQLFCSWLST